MSNEYRCHLQINVIVCRAGDIMYDCILLSHGRYTLPLNTYIIAYNTLNTEYTHIRGTMIQYWEWHIMMLPNRIGDITPPCNTPLPLVYLPWKLYESMVLYKLVHGLKTKLLGVNPLYRCFYINASVKCWQKSWMFRFCYEVTSMNVMPSIICHCKTK